MDLCRVLLVDDEENILEGYQKVFDWARYQCEVVGTALDGEEAVEKARELRPDIVIMDINLPKINGLEAIRIIQNEVEEGRRIHMVVVTGYDEFTYCQEALRLRVTDFLLKPIDFGSFGELMEELVKKVRENPQRRPPMSETLKKIIDWLEENMEKEDMSLTLLAERMEMNPAYISQLFKKELGMGYHAYLNQMRVERAKQYLREGRESVTSVAYRVGFGDYRVFTKVFKNVVGETPSQYRKK